MPDDAQGCMFLQFMFSVFTSHAPFEKIVH